jgi:Skp family chaperone for outer membrane proteins
MKKLLFVCLAFTASILFSNTTKAQQKIGYFDENLVLSLMPGYEKLQGIMESYQRDSVQVEYDYTYKEYLRQDSIFKKDSAGLPAKAREIAMTDINKLKYRLLNWQQISQEMLQAKSEQLLTPFRMKISEALNAVVAEQKYTLVLKGETVSPYQRQPTLEDLSFKTAIKMKLQLPKEYEDAWRAAGGTGLGAAGGGAAPATKPPVKAGGKG